MGMANEMQKLADEILASYKVRADELQQRLKDNDLMVKDVQEMLQGFRNDHQEIVASIKVNAKKLKADMANDEEDRLRSFKEMMDGIKVTISKIQDEVISIKISNENMLNDFSVAHKDITAKMQEEFANDKGERAAWNADRIKSFDAMMQGINDDMARIRQEVGEIFVDTDNMMKDFTKKHSDMSVELRAELQTSLKERQDYTRSLLSDFSKRLAEISKENQQMAKQLHNELDKSRKDLADSEVQRLKDFKVTMGAIQGKVNEIQTFVNTFLRDLKNERVQVSAIWGKLAEAKARSFGKMAEPAPVAKKEDEVKVKPTPKAEEPKEVEEEEKELPLEDRVLNHINKHPKGVRISDMEEPLGETRMRIGFIAKQLLDNGKVLKLENRYYPEPAKKEDEVKVKPTPKAEEPKEVEEEEKELSLEDRVLNHINKHPKGVRVSDMEEPLGKTRMQIGFIAKQLLDNGKVLKLDNRYYPKPAKRIK